VVDVALGGQALGTPTAEPSFPQDVRAAVRLWRGNITVPAIYLVIAVANAIVAFLAPRPAAHCTHRTLGSCPVPLSAAASIAGAVTYPFLIFQIGLAGAARVWYLRRTRGHTTGFSAIWTLSWRFFGRFFLCGLWVFLIGLPVVIVGTVAAAVTNNATILIVVTFVLPFVLIDIALTFVSPWLALFQPDAWQALRGGWQILRAALPRCLPYALVPPLALQALGLAFRSHANRWVVAAFALAGPPLTLAFAGATVLFLLRRYPEPTWNGSLDIPV